MSGNSASGQAMPTMRARANPNHVLSAIYHTNSAAANNAYASMLAETPDLYISALNSMNSTNDL